MSMTYKVNVSDMQPTSTSIGLFWVKPSISELYVRTGDWTLIQTSDPISTYTDGEAILTLAKQESEPPAPAVGQLWFNTLTNQMFIYMADWLPYGA
jgi:hypothetical protein